jgi:hypothetical protein
VERGVQTMTAAEADDIAGEGFDFRLFTFFEIEK